MAPSKVAALTQGQLTPSPRFRIRQMLSAWRAHGLPVEELLARLSASHPPKRLARPAWTPRPLASATYRMLRARTFAAVIVHREQISALPSVEERVHSPFVADVNDAIWLHRYGRAVRHRARHASAGVAGNENIAERFAIWRVGAHAIPSGVDSARFRPLCAPARRDYGFIDLVEHLGWPRLLRTAAAVRRRTAAALRRKMGEHVRAMVCQYFSLDAICRRWKAVLKPVLA